jgi:uncharacterized protein YcfJ
MTTPSYRIARSRVTVAVLALAGLAGCAVAPSGPSLTALPGSGRSIDQFRLDDALCRQSTTNALGGQTPQRAANESVAAGAVGGAAIGALAGAALGGSRGASVGAGTGLLMGSLAGSAQSPVSSQRAQFGFDQLYFQCMYQAGHRVPVNAASMRSASPAAFPANQPAPVYRATTPLPPPGLPPAPPPGLAAPMPRALPPGVAPVPGFGTGTPAPSSSGPYDAATRAPLPPPGLPPAPPRTW